MSGCLSLASADHRRVSRSRGNASATWRRATFSGSRRATAKPPTINGVFDSVRRGRRALRRGPRRDVRPRLRRQHARRLGRLRPPHPTGARARGLAMSLEPRAEQLSSIERVYAQPAGARAVPALARPNTRRARSSCRPSPPRPPRARRSPTSARPLSAAGSPPSCAASPSLGERIQDRTENATRFVVVATQDAPRTGADKTTLAFSLPDAGARGALKRVLEVFDERGHQPLAHRIAPEGNEALGVRLPGRRRRSSARPGGRGRHRQARARCETVKVLGSYPRFAPK